MGAAPTVAILDIGMLELMLLGIASIMLFGGDLPDVARKAGRWLGRLRATADELKRQIDMPEELRDARRAVRDEARMLGEATRIEDPELEERRRQWREELYHEEVEGRPPVARDPIDVAAEVKDAVGRDDEDDGEPAMSADDTPDDETPSLPSGAGPHDPLADRAREDPTWRDAPADDAHDDVSGATDGDEGDTSDDDRDDERD